MPSMSTSSGSCYRAAVMTSWHSHAHTPHNTARHSQFQHISTILSTILQASPVSDDRSPKHSPYDHRTKRPPSRSQHLALGYHKLRSHSGPLKLPSFIAMGHSIWCTMTPYPLICRTHRITAHKGMDGLSWNCQERSKTCTDQADFLLKRFEQCCSMNSKKH